MKDEVTALARVQAYILQARHLAAETKDPWKRDACLRVADALEERARELADGRDYGKRGSSSSTR